MSSLSSAIEALPVCDGNRLQMVSAVLTDRGVQKVTRHLRERDVLDDGDSVRDLIVKQYFFLSAHGGRDREHVVTMAVSLATSESQADHIASVVVFALPSRLSVVGNFAAQNRLDAFAEPLFDSVTSAIQDGHATRGFNRPSS